MASTSHVRDEGWIGHGLTITVSKRDELRAGVRLVGELDLASVPILTACLENLAALGARYVRADLSGLSFIDCAGLGALLEAHFEFLRIRGTLIITGTGPTARRLMRITGLDEVLLVAAPRPKLVDLPVA